METLRKCATQDTIIRSNIEKDEIFLKSVWGICGEGQLGETGSSQGEKPEEHFKKIDGLLRPLSPRSV